MSGHDLAMRLRCAYLSMHRKADSHLARFGVTADQFVLLTLLSHEDGITQKELGLRSSSDPNTLRAMLVLLERQSFLVRHSHPTDGRAKCVALTDAGRRVQKKLWKAVESFHDGLLALFQADEMKSFLGYLDRVAQQTPNRDQKPNGPKTKVPCIK